MRRIGWERETQRGGVDRGAEIASPVVGHYGVVEHPHRDVMSAPGPHVVLRDVGPVLYAAGEGIQEHWRVCTEVTDHEVARQSDARELDPRSASNLDVHDGQQYR